MKKKVLALVLALSLTMSFSACSINNGKNPGTDNPKPGTSEQIDKENAAIKEFAAMLPDKAGAEWKYNGFAEYGHSMKLDAINKDSKGEIQYLISGLVDDMSGGESKDDFSLSLKYVISKDGIKEIINKGDKMPHKVRELDVLRAPLAKGSTWTQKVDINGQSVELKAAIIDVLENSEKGKVIKVEYTAPVSEMPNNTYKEVRIFEEGKGMTSFENTFDKDIDFNYSLFNLTK